MADISQETVLPYRSVNKKIESTASTPGRWWVAAIAVAQSLTLVGAGVCLWAAYREQPDAASRTVYARWLEDRSRNEVVCTTLFQEESGRPFLRLLESEEGLPSTAFPSAADHRSSCLSKRSETKMRNATSANSPAVRAMREDWSIWRASRR